MPEKKAENISDKTIIKMEASKITVGYLACAVQISSDSFF